MKVNLKITRIGLLLCALLFFAVTGCEDKKNIASGTPPDNPVLSSTVEVSGDSATLNWATPQNKGQISNGSNARIVGYVIEYSVHSDFSTTERKVVENGDETSLVLKDLNPDGDGDGDGETTYYVRAFAKNNNTGEYSRSGRSTAVSFKIGKRSLVKLPGSPKDLVAVRYGTMIGVNFKASKNAEAEVDGVESKVVRYICTITGEGNFLRKEIVEFPASAVMFTELTPETAYDVKIVAVNSAGLESEASHLDGITTTSLGAEPPGIPANLRIHSITEDGSRAIVRWSAPRYTGVLDDGKTPAKIVRYVIILGLNPDFSIDNVSYVNPPAAAGAEFEEFTFTDLVKGATYYAKVSAVNDNGISGKDTSLSVVLSGDFKLPNPDAGKSEAPDSPESLSVDTDIDSAEFKFTPPSNLGKLPNGDKAKKIKFEVELALSPDFSDGVTSEVDYDPNDSTGGSLLKSSGVEDLEVSLNEIDGKIIFKFDNLITNTRYYGRIRAKNENKDVGVLQYSDWNEINDKDGNRGFMTSSPVAPGMPKNVSLTKPTDGEKAKTELIVSWEAPENKGSGKEGVEASIEKYLVYYADAKTYTAASATATLANGYKGLKMISASGNETTKTLTGLKPNTTYNVFVVAVNNNPVSNDVFKVEATSDKAEAKAVKTSHAAEAPKAPMNFKVGRLNTIKGKNSLVLSWTKAGKGKVANGDDATIVKYLLEYAEGKVIGSSSNFETKEIPGAENSYVLEGLKTTTEYTLRLIAVNGNETDDSLKEDERNGLSRSKPTAEISGSTHDGTLIADKHDPPLLASIEINPYLNRITLDIPAFTGKFGDDGVKGKRTLEYRKNDPSQTTWLSVDIDNAPVKQLNKKDAKEVGSLEEGSEYLFRVKLTPSDASGSVLNEKVSYSDEVTFTTASESDMKAIKPPTLEVILGSQDYDSVKLRLRGDACINKFGKDKFFKGGVSKGKYTLQKRIVGSDWEEVPIEIEISAEEKEYEVTGLVAEKVYQFRLVAVPQDGTSDRGDKYNTEGDPSGAVMTSRQNANAGALKAADQKDISISLSWDSSPNVTYKLYYTTDAKYETLYNGFNPGMQKPAELTAVPVSSNSGVATASSLNPESTYHFALYSVYTNKDGDVYSKPIMGTFGTRPSAPKPPIILPAGS